MGSKNSKTGPVPENQSAEAGSTAEAHEIQPARKDPSDVSHMKVHCIEDHTQQPPQVYCFEDTKQQPTQVYCVEDSVQQPTSEETSRPSKVVCGTSEEGKIAPELMELIEKLMENDDPSTRTDIVCQEERLAEGSGDPSTLKCDLYSTPVSEMEPPKVAKEPSEALPPPPPPVETLDSIEDAKPQKEFKETHPDVPVAEVTGEQTASLAAQQKSPEGISDAAAQTVPAGKDAAADAGRTEEKEEYICVCTRVLKTEEKGTDRTVEGQKQEDVVESH